MSKAEKEIIAGAEQALAYLKGDKTKGRAYRVHTRDIDVKAIRENLHMTHDTGSFFRDFCHSRIHIKKMGNQ